MVYLKILGRAASSAELPDQPVSFALSPPAALIFAFLSGVFVGHGFDSSAYLREPWSAP